MKAIYGLYPDADSAQRAVNSLRAAGIPDPDITIMSSEPILDHEFGRRDEHCHIRLVAGAGGVVGALIGLGLTSLTQLDATLITGGMPIVTYWTNVIVIFELAMLGAIFATIVNLLLSTGMPNRLPEFYDTEVSNGKILIGVADPPETRLRALEEALQVGGELKRIP